MSANRETFCRRVSEVLREHPNASVALVVSYPPPKVGMFLTWEETPEMLYAQAGVLLNSAVRIALRDGNFALSNKCDAALEFMGLAPVAASVSVNGKREQ